MPLLIDPVFADYMQGYGQGGRGLKVWVGWENLAGLYWYTVEFRLIEEAEGLRIYGAGIASLRETSPIFALDDSSPNRLGFDLERVMRTLLSDRRLPAEVYFVIRSIQRSLQEVTLRDFEPLYERPAGYSDCGIAEITRRRPGDHRGEAPRAYAKTGGRLASAGGPTFRPL